MTDTVLVNSLHPSVVDKLDPEFAAIYTQYQAPKLRADQVPYEEYNKDRPKYTFPTTKVCIPAPEVGSREIHRIPISDPAGEIAVEVFQPTPEASGKGYLQSDTRLPALVNYHGGGFVIGTLATDEPWCRKICQGVGCVVVNVEYRMAPEFPHPVPTTDAWASLKWVVANADALGIDISRIAVSGLSAGGCLAATVALLARDDPEMPKLALQLLIVPVLDARFIPIEGSCDPELVPYDSYVKYEFAPMLPLARLVWFYNLWLGTDEDTRKIKANDFRASPMVAENFGNLAPASFHSAEIDPLSSEALVYHEKLKAAGTASELKIYPGVGHPFSYWDAELTAARDFIDNTTRALRLAFGSDV